jgi:molybdopterin/thiamine biosynthesis adenylyltransferase
MLIHEQQHRGPDAMYRLADTPITICGAGALGGNLTETLARMGAHRLTVVDFDDVEERNLSTQPYGRRDIGAPKARVLAGEIYRAVGVEVDARLERLTADNVDELLEPAELVVDCFDNSASRRLVTDWASRTDTACLHAGMAYGFGECVWNEDYTVPRDEAGDVCDYPLARSLVLMCVGVAAELVAEFVADGGRRSVEMTLGDLRVGVRDERS